MDNIVLSAGTADGPALSTDEVTRATVVQHVQYVKLMNGTDAAIDIIPGDATNGLDVDVTRVGGTVTVGGVDASGAAISGNPVLMGGENPSGNVARLQTAADGDLIVHQHSASTALADNVANTMHIPVNQTDLGFLATPTVGYVFDGTAWDRMRGDATDGVLVNLGANNDVTVTGTVELGATALAALETITVASVTAPLAAGDNNIGNVDVVTLPGAAHDAAISGNPVRIAGRAMSADYTSVDTGDTADLVTTLNGHLVVQPYSIPELTWSYAAASGGITNTTGVTAKAAAAAGIRNYITRCQVINGHATVDTDVQIRDGAAGTVLWRGFAKAAGGGVACDFDPPLRGTAATLVEVACGTTGSATYFNLQGYTGP